MGWWTPGPELEDGETVQWSSSANREQSARRQVGGAISLTERRLIFVPNRFDAATGGEPWSTNRADIQYVGEVPRETGLRLGAGAAANRRRMQATTVDGEHQLFVVNHLTEKVSHLRTVLALHD
jgi:hypothetical protein